jgi:hypothetical protein
MGHLQVFSVTHNLLLNYNARFIHTYVGHKELRLFSFTPYLGILTSVEPLYQPNNKVKIVFSLL